MGVPKFFRYISERYPCLSELAREQNIPEFDNLYLDMNGIIHNCSHPDDSNIHFHITEEDMFKDIFNYIDKLFFLINPRKLFFMAVDGVAPRAKMNQQRGRRFRSAKEGEVLKKKAILRGEELSNEPFDSNCITPGTEFMSRLHEALRYFINSKISSNPIWQKCRVILSGHDKPGEGEHKIMDYIRYLKSLKDYDPNTRHCLYGLDADLIILGLCTHELHFVVLREEVKFGRKAKKSAVEETRFFLLHLGLLQEYLEMEFDELFKQNLCFDIVKLVDDWVLMGFLVGNDFIPHLPYLHITSNALPLLYSTYIKIFPTLGGHINENGKLNLERLEKYFKALSEVELELFRENYADLKYFETKQLKNGIDDAFDFDVNDIRKEDIDNELAIFIESTKQFFEDDGSYDENQQILQEFETYKRNYYMKKLHQTDMSRELKREQAICYVTALQWVLDYYYRGVQSWDWYYPHHYAPFISDLKDFKHHNIKFNMGNPFLPFEQLLAVLPAASKQLLPPVYRELMTSNNSKLKHFYPDDFETDLNGKKQEWEAVVLIPFIDENILLEAMKPFEKELTASEKERNRHGPMLQYDYNPVSQGNTLGIYSFSALDHTFCTETRLWSNEISTSDKTVCIEQENTALKALFPGFPTMKHLKYDFRIQMSRIKVFDHASRSESLIVMPYDRPEHNDIFIVAEKFLNKVVFIGWPYLIKAKVIAVSNKEKNIGSDGIKDMEPKLFQLQSKTAQEHFTTRMGIEFSNFSVLVHVKTHIGTTYVCGNQGKITIKDAWSPNLTAYPAQGVVSEITIYTELPCHLKQIENLFPVNSTIFFVGNPYFGSEGIVLNPLLVYECGRLKINITVLPEPDFTEAKYIQNQLESDYINSYEASALTGIHAKCLGRITGTILVVVGKRRSNLTDSVSKTNIGLQLKFPKQQEERAGYARRVNNQWYYSSKAITLVKSYCSTYPSVVEYLAKSSDRSEFFFESDLFPDNVGEGHLEQMASWIKSQYHLNAERIVCGSKTVEKEAIEKVLESIEKLKTLPVKTVKLQVKPHLLIKPDVSLPDVYKSRRAVRLFDRVVVVKTTYMVPLGSKGTVVGIHPISDQNPVRLECLKKMENFLDILFDKYLPNGYGIHGIAQERVYKVPESSILLIYNLDAKQTEPSDNKYIPTPGDGKEQIFPSPFNTAKDFNISDVFPATNNNLLLRTPQPCLRTQKNETSDEFWMPSANVKVKQSTTALEPKASHFISTPMTVIQNSGAQGSNFAIPNECKASTQVLKNLLGLDESNLNSTTVINNMDLPTPPVNWRNNSADCNVNLCNDKISLKSTLTIGNNVRTLGNIYVPTFSPDKSCNFGNLSQKEAFRIPIQRKQTTSTIHELTDSININDFLPNDVKPISKPTKENNYDTSKATTLSAKQLRTHKKAPRIPKIGAKFDYAP